MSSNRSRWQQLIGRELLSQQLGKEPNNEQGQPSMALIDSQSVLEVRGPDAEKFLQGQCTADIAQLTEGRALPGSICTVKGRVLCTFIAIRKDDRLLLRMTAELIGAVLDYLKKFAAFYKVDLIEWGSPSVLCTSDLGAGDQSLENLAIPLFYSLGTTEFREYLVDPDTLQSVIALLQQTEIPLMSENSWLDRQIKAGWLNLNADTSEQYLPHQLNLERLGAISFSKGCYTGQEIIARTEYRGKPKRRMHLVGIEFTESSQPLDFPVDIQDLDKARAFGSLICLSSTMEGSGWQSGLAILPIENEGHFEASIQGSKANISVPEQPYPSPDN